MVYPFLNCPSVFPSNSANVFVRGLENFIVVDDKKYSDMAANPSYTLIFFFLRLHDFTNIFGVPLIFHCF